MSTDNDNPPALRSTVNQARHRQPGAAAQRHPVYWSEELPRSVPCRGLWPGCPLSFGNDTGHLFFSPAESPLL